MYSVVFLRIYQFSSLFNKRYIFNLQAINESSEQGSSTEASDSTSLGSDNTVDSISPVTVTDQQQLQQQQQQQSQQQSQQPYKRPTFMLVTQDSVGTRTEPSDNVDSSNLVDDTLPLPYDLDVVETNPLLNVSILNQWDYPIFDMADQYSDSILSQVSQLLYSFDFDLFINCRKIPFFSITLLKYVSSFLCTGSVN